MRSKALIWWSRTTWVSMHDPASRAEPAHNHCEALFSGQPRRLIGACQARRVFIALACRPPRTDDGVTSAVMRRAPARSSFDEAENFMHAQKAFMRLECLAISTHSQTPRMLFAGAGSCRLFLFGGLLGPCGHTFQLSGAAGVYLTACAIMVCGPPAMDGLGHRFALPTRLICTRGPHPYFRARADIILFWRQVSATAKIMPRLYLRLRPRTALL